MRKTLATTLAAALFWLSPGLGAHEAAAAVLGRIQSRPTGITFVSPTVLVSPAASLTLSPNALQPVSLLTPPTLSPVPSLIPAAPLAAPQAPAPAVISALGETVTALQQPQAQPETLLNTVFDASHAPSGTGSETLGSLSAGPSGLTAPAFKPQPYDHGSNMGSGGGDDSGKRDWKKQAKEKAREYHQRFVTLLRNTAAEIFIVGALGLFIGIGYGHHHEHTRAKAIPLGFSEIHQIERDAAKQDAKIEPMTRYLTGVNDLTMKVFESWNESHERTYTGSNIHAFASEMDRRMDRSLKFHRYEIVDYLADLPAQSDSALQELAPFVKVRSALSPIGSDFSRSWDESHIDSYRTEYYTVTVDDGDGKSHTEERSRQVYDHTTHSYDYNKTAGENASAGLDKLILTTPELSFKETLRTASQTNAEGEYGAEKSRRNISNQKFTQKDYTEIANMWATGSTLKADLPVIMNGWQALHGDNTQWNAAKRTAHDDWYITYSHYDSGPREYQTAQQALSDVDRTAGAIDEVVGGIEFTKANIPVLKAKIDQLVELYHHNKEAEGERLMDDIVSLSQELYMKNFKNGFEVDPYRWWFVLMMSALGMFAGGLAGWGLDVVGDKKGWYDKLLDKFRRARP